MWDLNKEQVIEKSKTDALGEYFTQKIYYGRF
jgi:hypothetical protein